MSDKANNPSRAVHLFAGGVAGTLAAVITCPLDVAKTRFQSSLVVQYSNPAFQGVATAGYAAAAGGTQSGIRRQRIGSLYSFFRHLIKTEGASALFKGLGPTLVGIAPARSIYFFTYASCKQLYSDLFHQAPNNNSSLVHLSSAATAGAFTTTVSNPIWLVKTRLQLDQKTGMTNSTLQCIKRVYEREGIRGFYRGLTASYYGVAETAIHFVIYEALRERFVGRRQAREAGSGQARGGGQKLIDILQFMASAATSKTIATCIAYPHEVARTRMREEGGKYVRFWQTLHLVATEEGFIGLYRGMGTQLIKHIPSAAIVLATYEVIVDVCKTLGL